MPAFLILRFEAPLMSFGGVRVDETNPTSEFPGLSMLTGLLGNALGLEHGQGDVLMNLQEQLIYSVRVDVAGTRLIDYQTVALGQDFMRIGWTTWGQAEGREGSKAAREGTHQRWRHYWADRVVTVALTVGSKSEIYLDQIKHALSSPARTLFVGRKPCIPSAPILRAFVESADALEALENFPLSPRGTSSRVLAQWPQPCGARDAARLVHTSDERDWRNQVHVGRRKVYQGEIDVAQPEGVSA